MGGPRTVLCVRRSEGRGLRPSEGGVNRRERSYEQHLAYRVRNLPDQIARTRAKLARLEAEAARYGFHDLVERRA